MKILMSTFGSMGALLLVVSASVAAQRSQPELNIPKWEIFELALTTARNFDNPFSDVTLKATVTKGTQHINVDGFYDGKAANQQHVFRIRFSPDQEGSWSYTTTSNIDDLTGKSGTFQVVAAKSAGGLMRKAGFPHSFFRSDGTYFYPVNFGLFPHPSVGGGAGVGSKRDLKFPTETEMMSFLDTLGKYHINLLMDIRVLYQRCDRIWDPTFYPPYEVRDQDQWKIDSYRFNIPYFNRLERELERAKRYGIFYILQIMTDQAVQRGENTWMHSFYNAQNGGWLHDKNRDGAGDDKEEYFNLEDKDHLAHLQALQRYTISRTAAYWNVLYRIGGDSRNEKSGREIQTAETATKWFAFWWHYIRSIDPYQRPLTIGRAREEVMNAVGSDWNAVPDCCRPEDITACGGTPIDLNTATQRDILRIAATRGECFWSNPDYSRPIILYEIGPIWARKDLYELERKAYWVALASGWTWARPDSHFEVMVEDPPRFFESKFFGFSGEIPLFSYLRHLSDFLTSSSLAMERMGPYPQLISRSSQDVYLLASPGREYLAVFPFGGAASLRLGLGSYDAQFFDPRNGAFQKKFKLSGGEQTVSAPTTEDWVLLIRRH